MSKALARLLLRPGINTQASQTANEGGWSMSNLVRWKDGFLEKVGGWARLFATQLTGATRGIHAYQDLDANKYLLLGASGSLQIYSAGALRSFPMPGAQTNLLSPWMAVTNGLTLTTVTYNSHPFNTGDYISFPIPIQVGAGQSFYPGTAYQVTKTGVNTFTFVADRAATATTTGGTSAAFIQSGAGSTDIAVSFGAHGKIAGDTWTIYRTLTFTITGQQLLPGNYLISSVGGATSLTISTSLVGTGSGSSQEIGAVALWGYGVLQYNASTFTAANHWFIDNLGENMVACFTGGPFYQWSPPLTSSPALNTIAAAPSISAGLLVAMPQAQVICFGADSAGVQDPLLLRWSDAGDTGTWTAASTNQAGSYRLSRGSRIVGAIQAPQATLIWTDLDVWVMQYVGPPFIYSFSIVGSGCGLISAKARAVLGGITYWMSTKGFFQLGSGGGAVRLPCDVWDMVFADLDTANEYKCWAWPNSLFNEVWFFYPSSSGGTGEVDKYVKVTLGGTAPLWDYGSLVRTAGLDQSGFGYPLAVDGNRRVQQHESGYDNDTVAMSGVYAESGYIDLAEGTDILVMDQIIPDLKWFGSNGGVTLTVKTKDYPSDSAVSHGPFSVTNETPIVPVRARARLAAFRIDWIAKTGFAARMMALRYRWRAGGRRP